MLRNHTWFRWGWWALILLECGANAIGVLAPLDRDEGAFLVIAQEILRGHVPYRDVFDQKSPGVYYLLALLLFLTPRLSVTAQIIVLRLSATLANLLTALGLARLGQRWFQFGVGQVAALFWLAFAALGVFGANQLFTEPFATAATVWAVALLADRFRWWTIIEAGLLLAVGTFFKQTALLSLPLMLVMLWLQARAEGAAPSRQIRAFALLLAAIAAPWVLLGAGFAAVGGFNQFVYQTITANLVAYPPATGFPTMAIVVIFYLLFITVGPLVFIAARLMRWTRQDGKQPALRRERWAILVFLALLPVFPFFLHPYPHYLIQALPWVALLLALGLCGSRDAVTPTRAARLALPIAIALPILTGISLASVSASSDWARLTQQVATGAAIARVTSPSVPLLVAPAEPEYYYLAGRAPVTPYIYLLPINRAEYPIARVTDDIRARRFDVVIWFPNTVESDSPIAFAGMFSALQETYTTLPQSNPAMVIFVR